MKTILRTLVLFSFGLLAACTVQLAPNYDEELVNRLDATNTKAMTIFASVDGGSPKEEFEAYEPKYTEIVGELNALKQRAETRQMPPLAAKLEKIKFVSSFCNGATDCVNASPRSLERAAAVIAMMRTTHKEAGLAADLVPGFETDYETAIKQALFVERALER